MILIRNKRVILVSFWQCQTGRVLPYCLLQTRHNICGKRATCTRTVPRKKLGVTVATLVARHLLHVIANATSLTTRDGAYDSTRSHAENGRTYGESIQVGEASGMLCARDYCRGNVRQFQAVQGVATVRCAVLGSAKGTERALTEVAPTADIVSV